MKNHKILLFDINKRSFQRLRIGYVDHSDKGY